MRAEMGWGDWGEEGGGRTMLGVISKGHLSPRAWLDWDLPEEGPKCRDPEGLLTSEAEGDDWASLREIPPSPSAPRTRTSPGAVTARNTRPCSRTCRACREGGSGEGGGEGEGEREKGGVEAQHIAIKCTSTLVCAAIALRTDALSHCGGSHTATALIRGS